MKRFNRSFGGGGNLSRMLRGEDAKRLRLNNLKAKIAFTLAEVLITLGIIGVIAAITMPTLIQNHQKKVYVVGLQKAVNITLNMFKKMQADEGVSTIADTELISTAYCNEETGSSSIYVFERIIPKYLKVIKVCENDECPTYKDAHLLSVDDEKSYKPFKWNESHSEPVRGFYTADGAIYYMSSGYDCVPLHGWWNIIVLAVDINGEKGPNIRGRDFFTYVVDYNKGQLAEGGMSLVRGEDFVTRIVRNSWKMDY